MQIFNKLPNHLQQRTWWIQQFGARIFVHTTASQTIMSVKTLYKDSFAHFHWISSCYLVCTRWWYKWRQRDSTPVLNHFRAILFCCLLHPYIDNPINHGPLYTWPGNFDGTGPFDLPLNWHRYSHRLEVPDFRTLGTLCQFSALKLWMPFGFQIGIHCLWSKNYSLFSKKKVECRLIKYFFLIKSPTTSIKKWTLIW